MLQFQETQPDDVARASDCFAGDLQSFVWPRELVNFDPQHVACCPTNGKHILDY